MPAVEITRSTLVNLGLSAHPDLTQIIDGQADGGAPDVVESFKRLVATDVLTADRDLVATVAAFTSPLELATYFINAKYADLNGASGLLGTTTSAVSATANGAGFVRTFQHGAIYFHPQVGAHELHGPVRLRWQELGAETSFLGFPTSDVTPGADVRSEGVFAHFQGGSIYWAPLPRREGAFTDVAVAPIAASVNGGTSSPAPAPAPSILGAAIVRRGIDSELNRTTVADAPSSLRAVTTVGERLAVDVRVAGAVDASITPGIIGTIETSAGAFEVHGAIRAKYLALGAEASILGYPRTDETSTPDGIGRFNHFQGGSIYWTPATSAHEVHGLIRDRWASLGWERNPQLGYPISDELIPDPRIGHRRPEVIKKPIVAMPSDMVKLPAEAALAGFPPSVVNTQPTIATRVRETTIARPIATPIARPATESALGRLSERTADVPKLTSDAAVVQPVSAVTLNPDSIAVLVNSLPASDPAARSVNRYGDFENGVLFWVRGATSATTLAPLSSTSDGTSLTISGADVAVAAIGKIGQAALQGNNVTVQSVSFVGTTAYSFDGAQTHNRRHRLKVIMQGIGAIASGPFGTTITGPVTAAIELLVEVWFDAANRRIALTPTQWTLTEANSSTYAAAVTTVLRARLDPLLWSSYELLTLPDTDNGAAIAVLSVKTLPNGVVAVFVEPRQQLVLGSLVDLTNAVAPTTVVLSQPK